MQDHEHPDSWYLATANNFHHPDSLDGSASCDVCVIGGGYTGLSSALHLAKRGYSVVLLEANKIGWGASGRNGGQLGSGHNKDQLELEKMLGPKSAKQLWELAEESKALTRQLISDYAIDCDLKPGIAHPDHKASYAQSSMDYVEYLNSKYNYQAAEYYDKAKMADKLGSASYFGGMMDHDSWHLHPLNLALGLADAARDSGAKIYESTRVNKIIEGKQITVETSTGNINTKHVVVACNGYLGSLEKRIVGKIMPINNFIIATEPLDASTVDKINPDDIAVADSRFVVNYYRLSSDKRLLFGGGENYSSKFPKDIKSFVRKPMLQVYPELADVNIDYGWGGTLAVTMNRMPHFGRLNKNNIYYAQGYSGHGVGLSILAGQLISDAMSGEAEKFDIFSKVPTSSFPGGSLLRWPALVLGMTYYALRDRL